MKQRPRYELSYEKNSDDDDEAFDLLERKPSANRPKHFVEADVRDGDTLQAIALRFNCTVAVLKSVNHIHRDNEIFAKGKLRIPVSAFSLLTEQEAPPSVHTSGTSSPTRPKEQPPPTTATTSLGNGSAPHLDLQQKLIVASVNASRVLPEPRAAAPMSDLHDRTTIVEEDDRSPLLTASAGVSSTSSPTRSGVSLETVVVNEFANGADFGLKWYHAIGFALVLVTVPLIYVLYIAEHPEKYHHHH